MFFNMFTSAKALWFFVKRYWRLFALKAYALFVAIVYIKGRRAGRKRAQDKYLRDRLEMEEKRSEFHRHIGNKQNENANTGPRSESELIDRLRNNGGL